MSFEPVGPRRPTPGAAPPAAPLPIPEPVWVADPHITYALQLRLFLLLLAAHLTHHYELHCPSMLPMASETCASPLKTAMTTGPRRRWVTSPWFQTILVNGEAASVGGRGIIVDPHGAQP
jgi:hypothetical protein